MSDIPEEQIFWRNEHRISCWPGPESGPPLADQIIVTDGGPWAEHNVVCAVCGKRGAILELGLGVFLPCDMCRREGWDLIHKSRRGLFKRLRGTK